MLKRLALNTASNLGTLFLKLTITFMMTPLMIRNLGHYDYGVWEMIGSIVGYMGMLDLGIRPAISRFAARYIALDDESSLRTLYATSWFFLLVVGVLIAFILTMWGLFFPQLLAESASNTTRYTWLLLILAAQLLITFPSFAAESYMESYQEYYLKNNITIINSIIGSVWIYFAITPSNALVLLGAVNALGVCSKYLFLVWFMQYRRPFLKLKSAYFSLTQLKELLRFSVKTLVQGVSTRMENATDSLVIGSMISPAAVLLFSIPANLLNHIRGISITVTHVFMPYLSGLSAAKNDEKIRMVYISSSKLIISVSMLLSIGAISLGESFLRLWVGDDIANSAKNLLLMITLFTVLPLMNPLSSRYLTAIDKHGFFAKWQPIVAGSNLLLSLLFVRPLGLEGVVLGSLIPALCFQPILLNYCCRHLNITVFDYLKGAVIPLLIPGSLMLATIVSIRYVWIIDSYFKLVATAVIGSLVFMLFAFLVALNLREKQQLFSLFKRNR